MTAARLTLLALVTCGACAHAPRPRVLDTVEATSSSPAVQQASRWAPQAHAHAKKLQARSQEAALAGDGAAAQIVGEHAQAAFEHSVALARLARAEHRLTRVRRQVGRAEKELRRLRRDRQRLEAEARDLEMRARVVQDAQPLGPSEPSDSRQEQARRLAATGIASQARLICLSARLLRSDEDTSSLLQSLQQAEAAAKGHPRPGELLDEVRSLRAACLRQLWRIRRRSATASTNDSSADALLQRLTEKEGLFAFRDDRGAVVVLRDVIVRGQLVPKAEAVLAQLGDVAKQYPAFPVLLVAHTVGGSASRQAEAVRAALIEAGAPEVAIELTHDSQPVVAPDLPGATARNERFEIVFVAPSP